MVEAFIHTLGFGRAALWMAALVALASCDASGKTASAPRNLAGENYIAEASASFSLVFPGDPEQVSDDPRYEKLRGTGDTRLREQDYIVSVILCAPDFAWIEMTSHSFAVVMPSERSAIWENETNWHPSDAELVQCVRESTSGPVAYRVASKGYRTWD